MSRGPRPPKALVEAIPITKARGIVQLALGGPERISGIAIPSDFYRNGTNTCLRN